MQMAGGIPMPNMSYNLPQMQQPRLPMANLPQMQMRLPSALSLAGGLSAQNAQPQADGKQMSMSLLRDMSFAPMKEEVLTATLSAMKQPATKENVELAKSMVQSGVPLTQENVKDLKASLSQLPNVKPSDMQAATFLKSAQLPMTPQNITTLSNFIATNPQLGACFFEISREFRRTVDNKKGSISADKIALMSKTSNAMGELMMNSRAKGAAGNAKAFKNMAGQAGINLPHYMMGSGDEELSDLMNELRKVLYYSQDEAGKELYSKLEQTFLKAEDALMAQKLINRANREGQENFYYIQIPIKIGNEELTAEFKLFYTTDYEGRRVIDKDNFEFELLVPSCNMGDSYFHVKAFDGIMNMNVGMENSRFANYMESSLPLLMEKMSAIGFSAGDCGVYVRNDSESAITAVEMESFEEMEALDLSY